MNLNQEDITAIIPCAGKATRMQDYTKGIKPKCMLEINNEPVIYYIINNLINQNIRKYILVLNQNDKKIVSSYLNHKFKEYHTSFEYLCQESAIGPIHAIYTAQNKVNTKSQLIVLSDTLCDDRFSFKEDFIVYQRINSDYSKWCLIELNKNGYITNFADKSNLIPAPDKAVIGIYYLSNSILWQKSMNEVIKSNKQINNEFQISSALEIYNKTINILGIETIHWYDCGSPETFEYTRSFYKKRLIQ